MSTHRQTQTTATALTIAALLGVGALAGCSGAGSSPVASSATATASGSGSGSASGSASASAAKTGSAAPAVAKSAPALLSGALAALRSFGGGVHVDITAKSSQGSIAYSQDSTPSGGRQVITIGRTAHVTILFIAGVGYVQANASGLAGLFQVQQQLADEFAGQWIALRHGDKLGASTYDDVTAGITPSSVATELAPSGTVSLAAPSTIDGQPVVGVQAAMPASAHFPAKARVVLYMTDSAQLRPVLSEVTNAGSYQYRMSFSHWGETLHLTAPAHAVPASAIAPAPTIA